MRATGWSPVGVVVVGMLLGPGSEPAMGSGLAVWLPPAPTAAPLGPAIPVQAVVASEATMMPTTATAAAAVLGFIR